MKQLPTAVTMGEPAGIAGEITGKAYHKAKKPFFVVGDIDYFKLYANVIAIDHPSEAISAFEKGLPVINCPFHSPVILGKPNPSHVSAIQKSIEVAVEYVKDAHASHVTTNPIQKSNMYQGGFNHPGHTEFLGYLTGVENPVMMLVGDGLSTVPVTVHVSLKNAIKSLTQKKIIDVLKVLRNHFGHDVRIVVSGLNPHAGENGTMGDEENTIIIPAIAQAQGMGIKVKGPYPADTMFHENARKTYDVAVAMTHDQALIPIKTLAFDSGINVTLGLPVLRTSPDHGTALDIAGKNRASANSLIKAIEYA